MDKPEPHQIIATPTRSVLKKRFGLCLLGMLVCVILPFIFAQGMSLSEINSNPLIVLAPAAAFCLCLTEAILAWLDYRRASQLAEQGTRLWVMLKDKHFANVRIVSNQRFSNRAVNYYFLEYNLPDGTEVWTAVPKSQYEAAQTGQRLEICYLEDNPIVQSVEQVRKPRSSA